MTIINRKKRFLLTTITSITLQLTTVISGLIIPRFIMQTYGSDVNGLINSIVQFLGFITLLDLGIGSVVQSALYKPIADNDVSSISAIMTSAQKFYTRIALILGGYVIILSIIYPTIIDNTFSYIYTASLICIISISSFMQYYYGVVDGLLLAADQRGYIQFSLQIISLLLNVVSTVLLIRLNFGIHIVKLVTSLIFIIRPIFLRLYVNHQYRINRHVKLSHEPLEQKWNGIAQHISYVVLNNTDVAVLTIFTDLKTVSVYSVYMLVVSGINQLFLSLMKGVYSLFGDLWARGEKDKLSSVFKVTEWVIHTATVWVFGCTVILIIPFVKVYTLGINDANYNVPVFSAFIVAAYAVSCLRLPYNAIIIACNHYRQTQRCYIITAALNILISVALVYYYGLVGVAIGTLIAMSYQTVWMMVYVSNNLLNWSKKTYFKQIIVDMATVVIAVLATSWIKLAGLTYMSWIQMSLLVFIIWGLVILLINLLLYRPYFSLIKSLIRKRIHKD